MGAALFFHAKTQGGPASFLAGRKALVGWGDFFKRSFFISRKGAEAQRLTPDLISLFFLFKGEFSFSCYKIE